MYSEKFISRTLRLFLLCGICALLAAQAYAQVASLSGRVTDAAGAAVPNVHVAISNTSGIERSTATDGAGAYRFLQLPPGTYEFKTDLKGFKSAKQTVNLLVDTPTTLDIRLAIGELSETVTVEDGALQLNTQDAALGNAFEGLRIRQLPLQDRNVANLLTLQAGVTPDGYVNGARSDQTNLTLDGIDINDQQTGDWTNSVLRVTPDSVQEFKVTTNFSNAAQGRSSGGQISLITRTGSNNWHGSLYYSNRDTSMTANDFFNNRAGLPRPELQRNLFGGSIGGPIIKDRAFFFYNYEGRRDDQQTVVGPQNVPLPSLGQGIVKYYNTAGGITALNTSDLNGIFPVGVNPIALAVFADAASRYPANDMGVGDGLNTGGYRFNASTPLHYNAHTAVLNFNLTRDARHVLTARANYQHDLISGAPRFPDTPSGNLWSHPTAFALQHTWAASSRLVNTLRVGLTREAFSKQGDSAGNQIIFRYVYSPRDYSRTLNRITPTWNIVNDVSWNKGNHTFAFGGNMRIIRNRRASYEQSYDYGNTSPAMYADAGGVLTAPFSDVAGSDLDLQAALAAVIGRYAVYSSTFNFGADGNLLPAGTPSNRDFATEEYEMYAQDTWHLRPNFTLTLGLRYSLERPVYEANGLEAKPTVSLSAYFKQRVLSASQGIPYNQLLSIDKSGPANGKPGLYSWDKNNFAPRIAFAWQPGFDNGVLNAIFGSGQKSVIRGGFGMAYDRIGSALAVAFDLNNSLGFSSEQLTSPNAYNVTDTPAPLFTGFDQVIRTLPAITIPSKLVFPQSLPADGSLRIQSSLDDGLKSPVNYLLNFSIAREFSHGLTVEATYVGRLARNLLAQRDVMQPNNLVDPKSGMDWYEAAKILFTQRYNNVPISDIQPIAYFENLFPDYRRRGWPNATKSVYSKIARDGSNAPDFTTLQSIIDGSGIYPSMFYQPQYGALNVWSTIGFSDYHAGILSVKERFGNSLNLDFNYTFSKSMDNASGLQGSKSYAMDAFIVNAIRPNDSKAISNFDMTHIININGLWSLPMGHGRYFLGSMGSVANQILGGWQLSSIFRWNSGMPELSPWDGETWATNWNQPSFGVRIRPINSAPTKSGDYPNLFKDPAYAYQSFRNAMAGETGDRNIFRRQGYINLDMGLSKDFRIREGHVIKFRWEVFNLTNTQRLGAIDLNGYGYPINLGLNIDPQLASKSEVPSGFGSISKIQGTPRTMQLGLRYEF
jgi:hypothetical protein